MWLSFSFSVICLQSINSFMVRQPIVHHTYDLRYLQRDVYKTKSTNHFKLFGSSAKLLPDPKPNAIGNFFENKTEITSFIQCYMLALGEVDQVQYGVGVPLDLPVMLTYFESNELKPVREDYPDYDHLVDHVTNQLENNDLLLYKTPVVLTLQGEFEDEEMNERYTTPKRKSSKTKAIQSFSSRRGNVLKDDTEETVYDIDDYEGEEEEEEEEEEVSIDEIISLEGLDDENMYDDYEDDEDFDDEDDDVPEDDVDAGVNSSPTSSFWNSSPVGKKTGFDDVPDYTVYRPENPDLSSVPADAFVTEEDTRSLRRAHKRADRIIQYAADIKLIASFHFKKKNFHLVKLLEPIFLVGKRIMDIKGYYFTLLADDEATKVTPQLEKLLINRPNRPTDDRPFEGRNDGKGSRIGKQGSDEQSQSATTRSSRRRWKDRKTAEKNSQ